MFEESDSGSKDRETTIRVLSSGPQVWVQGKDVQLLSEN